MTERFGELRARHPRFIYRRCSHHHSGTDLTFSCDFELEPDIRFRPGVTIHGVSQEQYQRAPKALLDNLTFHLGLMEIPSYWKCACSPEIVLEAGSLDADQVDWWTRLLLRGQGEFFYVNEIDPTTPDLVRFTVPTEAVAHPVASPAIQDRTLLPIGGGKDSAVSLGLLRQADLPFRCFALNPSRASRELAAAAAGQPQGIFAGRTIDPGLLQLNARGYLNGHTPFSAYIAFLSTAVASLFGTRWIALSNERSANEGNVTYHGLVVNHQYSKTFEFEQAFRHYSARYLAPGVEYFSFLRPLYELQISKLLSGMDDDLTGVIRSCNRGQKTDTWCEQCAKCLFVYATLFPFFPEQRLQRLFRTDLFANEHLMDDAMALVTQQWVKPFDCVGTREEALVAFHLSARKLMAAGRDLPPLLSFLRSHVLDKEPNLDTRAEALLAAWNAEHCLPPRFEHILRSALAA